MTLRTIEVRCCDLCDTIETKDEPRELLHPFKGKDICDTCYKELYLEYMRIFEKQVPDRRGGRRGLGELDT